MKTNLVGFSIDELLRRARCFRDMADTAGSREERRSFEQLAVEHECAAQEANIEKAT